MVLVYFFVRNHEIFHGLNVVFNHQREPTGVHLFDPVYTRANDSGFVANPECFDIGFVLPFTLRNINPIQNYNRQIMNPELSNPEKFVGSLYPRKSESDKTSLANSFLKRI